MRKFASRVELLNSSGDHLRYLPQACAREMVNGGSAEVANANGKVRSIRLLMPASSRALKTGKPSAVLPLNTRFTRRVHLACGSVVIEHHPRCTYGPPG